MPLHGGHIHVAAGSGEEAFPPLRSPGLSHLPDTGSEAARQQFDHGLVLFFAFEHERAIRSFRQALEHAPEFALAHWGIALANSANINAPLSDARERNAREAILIAASLTESVNARDRAYIDAMLARYPIGDRRPRADIERDYAERTRLLAERFPDDATAWVLYADALMNLDPWNYWTDEGAPASHTAEIVRALERALAIDPEHLGANHFYIHALEGSRHPERALPSALRLDAMKPGYGHLSHMPSHIYFRTGDYHRMIASNQRAIADDERLFANGGPPDRGYLGYHVHNVEFLMLGQTYSGDFHAASETLGRFEQWIEHLVGHAPAVEAKLVWRAEMLIRFGRWPELLDLARPLSDRRVSLTHWHYARGIALAQQGDTAGARHEREEFRKHQAKIRSTDFVGRSRASDVFRIAALSLDARIAAAEGDTPRAEQLLMIAAEAEDMLAYDEPPNWLNPVREMLGALLLRVGRVVDAEAVFRQELTLRPANPRALCGLARALHHQGRLTESELVWRRFIRAWNGSSKALPIFGPEKLPSVTKYAGTAPVPSNDKPFPGDEAC